MQSFSLDVNILSWS